MEKAIELALRTWYPKDHPLHFVARHPLGKLVGEWGELLDDYMKLAYKPNFKPDLADELGDIWYYIRILCYQRDYQPGPFNLLDYDPDRLITFAINEASNAFLSYLSYGRYSLFALDVSYTVLLVLSDRRGMDLDDLTESNWQKLKPGSVRGEEWVRAWNGT